MVKKLSGGEIFAILFCSLLFVGSIIALVLFVAYYKQWTYKKLAQTHSLNNSSTGITPQTVGIETAPSGEQVQEEQLNVTALDETSTSLDHVGEAPPVYCENSEHSHCEADHPKPSVV